MNQSARDWAQAQGNPTEPLAPAAPSATIITPTVGRRVWYFPSASDLDEGMNMERGEYNKPRELRQPFDAGVLYVHDARTINVEITDHQGLKHYRLRCTLVQEGDSIPADGHCEWMPYQRGKS